MVLRSLVVFLFLGFVMKLVGEAAHKLLGHGLFVLLFGGKIESVHISLTWPYELSYIGFSSPSPGFQPWQKALVDGGGILVCLLVSLIAQSLLLSNLSKRMGWPVLVLLFWLAFWTFMNAAGYLIMGGIEPFGDVAALISGGFLTRRVVLILGLLIFALSFFSLSRILKDVLNQAGIVRGARWSIAVFWCIVPVVTAFSLLGRGQSLVFLWLSFIPVLAAFLLHGLLLPRRTRERRV